MILVTLLLVALPLLLSVGLFKALDLSLLFPRKSRKENLKSWEDKKNVCVVGASIGGIIISTKLHNACSNQGSKSSSSSTDANTNPRKVVLVTDPGPFDSTLLINGCSLRSNTLNLFAKAFGLQFDEIVDYMTDGTRRGLFSQLYYVTAYENTSKYPTDGHSMDDICTHSLFTFGDMIPLSNSANHNYAVGISLRHRFIVDKLAELAKRNGVHIVHQKIETTKQLDEILHEENLEKNQTLMINATPNPHLLSTNIPKKQYKSHVLIIQEAYKVINGDKGGKVAKPFGDGVAAGIHLSFQSKTFLAFFTPFYDPLSPDATWYGINTIIVPDEELKQSKMKARLISMTKQALHGLANSLNLEPVQNTYAVAVLGVVDDFSEPFAFSTNKDEANSSYKGGNCSPFHFNTATAFHIGAKAINVDGMLADASGSTVVADYLLNKLQFKRDQVGKNKSHDDNDDDLEYLVMKELKCMRWRNRSAQNFFKFGKNLIPLLPPIIPFAALLTIKDWDLDFK